MRYTRDQISYHLEANKAVALAREINIEEFNSLLSTINNELQVSGSLNLLSGAVTAEEAFRRILNSLFGWSLTNANQHTQNAAGYDLIDESERILIQVSTSCTRQKISSTLKSKIFAKFPEGDYRLKFLFVGRQDSSVKSKSFKSPDQIRFNHKTDIILTKDLVRRFSYLDIAQQEAILHITRQELGIKLKLSEEKLSTLFKSVERTLGARYNPALTISTSAMEHIHTILFPAQVEEQIANASLKCMDTLSQITDELKENENQTITEQSAPASLHSFSASLSPLSQREVPLKIEDIFKAKEQATLISSSIQPLLSGAEDCRQMLLLDGKIKSAANSFKAQIEELHYKFLHKTFIVITGPAGVGKSHYIAHLCKTAIEHDIPATLFLGQSFTEAAGPLEQMARSIDPECSESEFLGELSRCAEGKNTVGIIAIDALNEGIGRRYWINHLQTLKDKIDGYNNLVLVVSIRSPYVEEVLPKEVIDDLDSNSIQLSGFDYQDDAAEKFCAFYKLEPPTTPLINAVSNNPLYLRLLCEAAQEKGAPSLNQQIRLIEAIDTIIKKVNKLLAGPTQLDYDRNINFVESALKKLASTKSFIDWGWIKYTEAYKLITDCFSSELNNAGKLLNALCDEDILRIDGRDDKQYLSFAFEKIGDYFTARALIDKIVGAETGELSAKTRDKLAKQIDDIKRAGVLEALASLLPDLYGIELVQLFKPNSQRRYIKYFIDSIPWREKPGLSTTMISWVNEAILNDTTYTISFLTNLFTISLQQHSNINAHYLHRLLSNIEPQRRDLLLASAALVSDNLEYTMRWIYNNAPRISPNDSIALAELAAAWCTALPNRRIRDLATNALSACLKIAPSTAPQLIANFSNCDDDFILERLFAAAYGAASNMSILEEWKGTATAAYNFVYADHETYPNIMIRNYVDCFIHHLVTHNVITAASFPRVSSPGKSAWYQQQITNDDIEKELCQVKNRYGEESHQTIGIKRIIHSMTTGDGQTLGGYGDFGRYVLQNLIHCWRNQFQSSQELANLATWEVLKRLYNADLHGEIDQKILRRLSKTNGLMRLSKKYQWIAMHRLLARLIDNFPPYQETKVYDPEIVNRRNMEIKSYCQQIFETHCYPPLPLSLSCTLDEQHIITREQRKLEDYELFNELSYVRDFDPTYIPDRSALPHHSEQRISFMFADLYQINETNLETFLKQLFDRIDETVLNDNNFTSLSFIMTEKISKTSADTIFFSSKLAFIQADDYETFESYYREQFDSSLLRPEIYNSVYIQEFCNGIGFKLYNKLRTSELSERESLVTPASYEYIWEDSSDPSENTRSLFVPSPELINFFKLRQLPIGTWINDDHITICSTEHNATGMQLLMDTDHLISFLKANNQIALRTRYINLALNGKRWEIWALSRTDTSLERVDTLIKHEVSPLTTTSNPD